MQIIDIKFSLILAFAQLVQKCVYSCNCGSICDCVDMQETTLYYCPNRTDSFVFAKLVKPKKIVKDPGIDITCSNPEINYFSYIPRCDWSMYRELTIEGCNVQSFVNQLFHNIKIENLSYLKILVNDVTNDDNLIHNDVFKSMPNLKSLYLRGKGIRVSNDFLFYTRKLTKLDIYKINLSNNLMSFDYVSDLIRLDVTYSNINIIPNQIFRYLSSLNRLNLSNNNLTTLTSEMFVGLQRIKILDFRVNAISYIAEDTFSNLSHLTELDLEQNKITNLPKNLFANNTKLINLWLSDNFLTVIPDQLFENCINLKILKLDSLTKLEYLPEKLFYNNNNSLEELGLAYSNLSEGSFSKTFFSNLKLLSKLNLSGNKFQKIDMSLFDNVRNLYRLELNSNLITTVKVVQLLPLATLILLQNNKISKVDFRLFKIDQQPKRIRIDLKNNPIACNCSNYDLHLFINKKCFGNLTNAIQFEGITSHCPNGVSFANLSNMNCPIRPHCPLNCSCAFSLEENIILVNCSSNSLKEMPVSSSFTKLTHFEWLKLYLIETFEAEFPNCIKPKVMLSLNLSGNLLEVVDYVPANLKYLDLSGNRIRRIDVDIVQQLKRSTTLMKVVLHGNPWDCGCGMSELGQLVKLKTNNSPEVYCEDNRTPLSLINLSCPNSNQSNIIAVTTVCLGLLLCLTATLAIYYKFKTSIKIFLFNRDLCLSCISENDIDPDKLYDVFISFSHEDEQFVTDHLLPGLEQSKKPYKVCIHTRDWIPGDFIVEQIVRSVSESRRTLVVLSNSFVNSDWGKMEFRTAHTKAINEGKTRVIVVLYGQLDENQLDDTLKNYIQTHTYVKWGDKYFWEKLKYALPHSSTRFIESNKNLLHHSLKREKLAKNYINEVLELGYVTNKSSSVILNPNTLIK